MSIIQTLTMAFKSILNNKIRSILTMLGIIIGVASVITLVASIQGLQQVERLSSEAMGVNRIDMYMYISSSKTREAIIEYCSKSMGDELLGMTPNVSTSMPISYRTKNMRDIRLNFGNEQYTVCASQSIAAGRGLLQSDIKNRARVCVIGETVRKNFFGAMSPLDKEIKINGQTYRVVGVYKGKYGGKLNTDDAMVLLPHTLQQRVMGWEDNSSYILRGRDTKTVKAFIESMTTFANARINPNYDYFGIYSNDQYQEQSQQQYTMMSLVAGGVAGISLLVGGIGIMNIMLVSVTERTREIGIRMAIGARRRDIIGQFLIEAGVVSAVGGLLGIAFGFLGSAALGGLIVGQVVNSPWMPDIPSLTILPSAPLVLGAFLFSALLGIIFGLYPANKASKMQPVDALRTQ